MKDENDILNNKLYKIVNYITYFFMENILFLLVISPLLIYILNFNENSSIGMMLVVSILIGPAITTLFSVMGKFLREGEISPIKDFFHFYKLNFLQGIMIATILNLLIVISYFDMNYFKSSGNIFLQYLFFACIVISMLIGFYIYPLISRYNLRIIHAFTISLKLLFTKIYLSLSSISIIIIVLATVYKIRIALVGVLFGASIICYFIMKLENKSICDLEDIIKEKYKNQK